MSSGILVSGDGLMVFWNPFFMVYCLHWLVMGCHQIVVAFSIITIFLSYPQLDIVEDSTRFCQCKNGPNEELEPRIWWLDSTLILFDTVCLWKIVWFLAFP